MRSGRRLVHYVAALLVLGVIYVDLVGAHCDLPPVTGANAFSAAPSTTGALADPCALGCVPDCFTCSLSEEASLPASPTVTLEAVTVVSLAETRASDGVLPLPYHPPLALLQ